MTVFESRNLEEWGYSEYRYLMFMLPIVLKAKTIVETGLGQGASTVIFLEACRFLGDCKLYTYEININKEDTGSARKKIAELNLTKWWTLIEKNSVQGGREWKESEIDILYLDSHHSAEHVYNELEAWVPHVKDTGIIFAHDTNPTYAHPPDWKPLDAFAKYAQQKNHKIVNLTFPQGMCFLIRRH